MTATLPHTDWLLEAHLSDGSVLEVTEDHRFWSVTDDAWVELQDLDSDDQLLTPDGGMVTVDYLDWDIGADAAAWDLTVAEEHNFFVTAETNGVPMLVHNANARGLFCGVPVGAEYVRNLGPVSEALEGAELASKAGDDLAEVFGSLTGAEQLRFLDSLAALQANVSDGADLGRRASRMIENAKVSPNHTKDLLESTAADRVRLELHLDQIRRNGADAAEDVVASARSGSPLGQPRDPELETNPTEIASATAEVGVSAYYEGLGSVVENMPDRVSDAVRDRIFVDIHGRRPPVTTKKPDLIVDGEFRDVYRPNPLTTPPSQALENGLKNKLKDGQTQRLDIWLDGLTIEQAEAAFDEIIQRFDGDLAAFAEEFSKNGRLPVEINVIEAATGESKVLYSAPDVVVVP